LIQVVDADGDTLAAPANDIVVKIGDDIPAFIGQPTTLQLDEDGLAGANIDSGKPGEVNFGGATQQIANLAALFSVGADSPGTFQFTTGAAAALTALNLTSNHVAIVFTANLAGDTITGKAGALTVLTLQLTAAGSLTTTLSDQIDHANSPVNTETNLSIDLSALIQVVDADGDTLAAPANDIVVKIGDDIPAFIGQPTTLQLDEDGL